MFNEKVVILIKKISLEFDKIANPILQDLNLTVAQYKIVKYLQSGIVLAACGSVVEDIINPQNGIIGTPDDLTDGTWMWPADLSYYVERYDLKLDEEFLDSYSIMKQGQFALVGITKSATTDMTNNLVFTTLKECIGLKIHIFSCYFLVLNLSSLRGVKNVKLQMRTFF